MEKNEQKDKNIIHAQAFLNEITGQEFVARLSTLNVKYSCAKEKSKNYVPEADPKSDADAHVFSIPLYDAEIKEQQCQYEKVKPCPQQDGVHGLILKKDCVFRRITKSQFMRHVASWQRAACI